MQERVEIVEEPMAQLGAHARVSCAFVVRSRVRMEGKQSDLRRCELVEEAVPEYTKDYDALESPWYPGLEG